MQDNNPGTLPLQSERLYSALKGLGKVHTSACTLARAHLRTRVFAWHMLCPDPCDKVCNSGRSPRDLALGVALIPSSRVSAAHAVGDGPVAVNTSLQLQGGNPATELALCPLSDDAAVNTMLCPFYTLVA